MMMPPCFVHSAKSPCAQIAGKPLEIGRRVFCAAGIVPELHRHRRKGHLADEFALLLAHRPARLVEHVDRHAEPRPLDFAAPDRLRRDAEHEAGDDVGAARDRGEMQVRLDRVVDEVEVFRRERRAGRGQHAHAREIVRVARPKSRLPHRVDEFRRRAEDRHPLGRRHSRRAHCRRDGTASRRRGGASLRVARPETSQFHIIQPSVVK